MGWTRRDFFRAAGAAVCCSAVVGRGAGVVAVATFRADITPPLGHPLLGGWIKPVRSVADPLEARGLLLLGFGRPVLFVALDWCELRNDAYDYWRDALARAAGTTRERVILACVHQHDAPYADLTAQRLMDQVGLGGRMFSRDVFEAAVDRVASAVRDARLRPQPITHFGIGKGRVEKVACNRRVELPGQPPRFNRYSFTRDATVRNAPEGEIDPWLRMLTFWAGNRVVAAMSCYAVHPMTYYGRGEVSADFPGLARRLFERRHPGVFSVHFSGCSGDVVAARYNDGTPASRRRLASRLATAMDQALERTRKVPLAEVSFRCVPVRLKPETDGDLAPDRLWQTLRSRSAPYVRRCHAALGLSWQRRCSRGQPIDMPVVDFGEAVLVLLPAEAFVAFQLAAQRLAPDRLVLTPGYGECAPGYIPTERARKEGFVREHSYCWVAPGAEGTLLEALQTALSRG